MSFVKQNENFLWCEAYRPKKIKDCILPTLIKQTLQQFIDQVNVPNLILSGGPGCGKTTAARAMLEELGCQYMIINGSLEGNIDTLRTQIKDFASAISLTGGRKYIILDEADYLNPNSTQPALRNFMEEFSKNCGFILTCNYKNKIIEPLHSRCSIIEFKFSKKDNADIAIQIFQRIQDILKNENVEYDKNVIATIIKKHYPDFRRIINELQRYSSTGKIDSGILTDFNDVQFNTLIKYIKDKSFTNIRKWVSEMDYDDVVLYRKLYDTAYETLGDTPESIAQLVLILAKYQYQAAFCADRQINTMACLVELMIEINWK